MGSLDGKGEADTCISNKAKQVPSHIPHKDERDRVKRSSDKHQPGPFFLSLLCASVIVGDL